MKKTPWTAWLAAAVMALLAVGCAQAPVGGGGGTQVVEIQVDKVEVEVLESDPVQVVAHITGVVGDSCNSLDRVTQSREGNRITLRITAIRQLGVACAQLAQLYDERVPLEGPFPPGAYTLTVNGVVSTFTVG